MNHIKSYLGQGAHCEHAMGSSVDASDYCKKDGHFEEFGEMGKGQGTRNDCITVRDAIANGATRKDLLDNDATCSAFFRMQRGIEATFKEYQKPLPRDDIDVALFFGFPGQGKSSTAQKVFPDAYWKNNTKWWDGYNGENTVIWDEFGGWSCAPCDYNKIFDRYPLWIENKGGFIPLRANKFIIISNFTPGTWWSTEKTTVNLDAVKRRIHSVYWFKQGEPIGTYIYFDGYASFDEAIRGICQ